MLKQRNSKSIDCCRSEINLYILSRTSTKDYFWIKSISSSTTNNLSKIHETVGKVAYLNGSSSSHIVGKFVTEFDLTDEYIFLTNLKTERKDERGRAIKVHVLIAKKDIASPDVSQLYINKEFRKTLEKTGSEIKEFNQENVDLFYRKLCEVCKSVENRILKESAFNNSIKVEKEYTTFKYYFLSESKEWIFNQIRKGAFPKNIRDKNGKEVIGFDKSHIIFLDSQDNVISDEFIRDNNIVYTFIENSSLSYESDFKAKKWKSFDVLDDGSQIIYTKRRVKKNYLAYLIFSFLFISILFGGYFEDYFRITSFFADSNTSSEENISNDNNLTTTIPDEKNSSDSLDDNVTTINLINKDSNKTLETSPKRVYKFDPELSCYENARNFREANQTARNYLTPKIYFQLDGKCPKNDGKPYTIKMTCVKPKFQQGMDYGKSGSLDCEFKYKQDGENSYQAIVAGINLEKDSVKHKSDIIVDYNTSKEYERNKGKRIVPVDIIVDHNSTAFNNHLNYPIVSLLGY
jgi:hypothetical protein